MQLILETDNPSLNLKENMSLKQDSLNEKPITNGDTKENEEVNEKINSNGTGNKTDIVDKINSITNAKDIDISCGKETTLADISIVEGTMLVENSNTDTVSGVVNEIVIQNNVSCDKKSNEEPKKSPVDYVHENEDQLVKQESISENKTEKCEPMEIDENIDCDHNNKDQEQHPFSKDILENDVTESISAMVEDIVKDLGHDTSSEDLDEFKIENDSMDTSENTIEIKDNKISSSNIMEKSKENVELQADKVNENVGESQANEVSKNVVTSQVDEAKENVVESLENNVNENVASQTDVDKEDIVETLVDEVNETIVESQVHEVKPNVIELQVAEVKQNVLELKVDEVKQNIVEPLVDVVEKNVVESQVHNVKENVVELQTDEVKENIVESQVDEAKENVVKLQTDEVKKNNIEQLVDIGKENIVGLQTAARKENDDKTQKQLIEATEPDQAPSTDAKNDINIVPITSKDVMKCVETQEEKPSENKNKEEVIICEMTNNTKDDEKKKAENVIDCDLISDTKDSINIEPCFDKAFENKSIVSEVKKNERNIECEADSDLVKVVDPSDSDIITITSSESDKVVDKSSQANTNDCDNQVSVSKTPTVVNDDIVDLDEVIESSKSDTETKTQQKHSSENSDKVTTPLIKLSNTLDILSDDDDEPPPKREKSQKFRSCSDSSAEKQCINLDDDDDIMLIDEDTTATKNDKTTETAKIEEKVESEAKFVDNTAKLETAIDAEDCKKISADASTKTDSSKPDDVKNDEVSSKPSEVQCETSEKLEKPKPLIPDDFFKSYRRNLSDMTRDDLEEFCILKIVESIIDRSNLNEIRTKIKTMAQNIEEYKKKATMLTKQNRDLQVVLKSVQEEQKKMTDQPIAPLKITRSVGMQVLMTDRTRKRQAPIVTPAQHNNTNNVNVNTVNTTNSRPTRNTASRPQKPATPQQIPVPRLVPATAQIKPTSIMPQTTNTVVKSSPVNGVKVVSAVKAPEKRTHSRMQAQQAQVPSPSQSVTVDLTDDEPPAKVVATKSSPVPPVRLVNQQNLLAPRQPYAQAASSPRKVYIPISGPGNQAVRSPAIMLKPALQGPRAKSPAQPMVRIPQNTLPVRRVQTGRHPAPLPDNMKQYQPPNWKALPPAPDLKLSKVENGIVISWKIDGYQEDSYEEIASYQLYAYQETSAPPNTSLWKKIGDVKALPLPMACTLTQFMAGYKYYFAVRAVDVRSRLGPFSLPGSILLLNKM